ncbi:MAG: serine/threonine protein kinase [bacterium]|nr:serine/threonine protein kinase [bacterium]
MNLLPDDPEHRDRLLRQLDALLLLDGPARDAALAELEPIAPALAAELRALLAADGQPGSILDEPLFAWAQPLLTEADAALPGGGGAGAAVDEPGEGALLGAWRLGQRLGAGGMGVVYAAQRSDGGFAQHAAIKVLAIGGAGGALAARFEQERAILARLSHPGIARLLDGGVTPAGTPWFAMELVDGMPLTAWCHEQGADLRTRLALIREVAAAVAHAHRHLVVHRDLKPSNILVEPDGRVKLLDFGIAKLLGEGPETHDLTLAGPRPFTPRYAAPEQVTGAAITTATDVYALGAILYELLCGRSPHGDATTPEHLVMRAVAEADPEPLTRAALRSSVGGAGGSAGAETGMLPPWGRNHLLGGDLQNIVGCCLAKDPARRYPAVDAMLDDLRRAEAGEPIRARAPTRRYLLAKFARRNRVAVTGAGLVVAALLAGLLATAWQARRAARETARAEQVHTFLLDLFAAADPATTRGRDVTARELLLRGSRELRTERAAQPELRAELLVTVGELLRQVGALADADTVLSAALRQAEQAHGRDSPEVGRVADALGGVVYELGRFEDAGALHARALAIHERVHGRRHRVTAGSLANLAGVLSQTGEAERGEALYREVLDIDRTLLGPADAAVATDLNNLAVCLYRAGRSAEADTLHEQALVLRRRLHGDAHPDVATSFHNRAAVLEDLGNAAAAEAHYRRALAIRRELYPQGHIDIAGTLTGLGTLLRDEGRLDEARALLVEAAEVNRTALAGPHLELGRCYNALGTLAYSRGHYDEAAGWFVQARDVLAATIGPDNTGTMRVENNIAVVLHRAGRLAEAQAQFEKVIADRIRMQGAAAPDIALSTKGLGWLLLDRGQFARADSLLTTALATLEANPHLGAAPLAEARLGVGACRLRQGRRAEAESLLVAAARELEAAYDPGHEMVRRSRELLRELSRK